MIPAQETTCNCSKPQTRFQRQDTLIYLVTKRKVLPWHHTGGRYLKVGRSTYFGTLHMKARTHNYVPWHRN